MSVLKEPLLVKVRLLQTIMVSLLIGVIFFGQQLDQDGVMNINGALFLFLTNMTFQNVFAVINVYGQNTFSIIHRIKFILFFRFSVRKFQFF